MADNSKNLEKIRMGLKDILNSYLNLVKRFVPAAQVRSVVGVDLSADSCKMVELQPGAAGTELVSWAIEPVVEGNQQEALRKVLGKLRQPATVVHTALYGKGTLVRYLDMPRLSMEDLKKSFAFEVDKYFPFPKDQIFTDCHILNAKEKENRMLVLAAAAKREMVTKRQELLKALGLEADSLTINSLAIANLFAFQNPLKNNGATASGVKPAAAAIVDIGEKISNLSIVCNGEPRFTRDIFLGGSELTATISNALSLDAAAAEEMKRTASGPAEEIMKAGESWILNLVGEIRLSFDYFATEKNIPVTEVLLTGGGAALSGLPEIFTKYLEVPAKRWDPLVNIAIDNNLAAGEVKKHADRLSSALGLAVANL